MQTRKQTPFTPHGSPTMSSASLAVSPSSSRWTCGNTHTWWTISPPRRNSTSKHFSQILIGRWLRSALMQAPEDEHNKHVHHRHNPKRKCWDGECGKRQRRKPLHNADDISEQEIRSVRNRKRER